MRIPTAVLAMLCAMLYSNTSVAKEEYSTRACVSTPSEQAISECTRLIDEGHLKGEQLAVAYEQRGALRFLLKQYDLSLQDLNRAIAILPEYTVAFEVRGSLYLVTGQAGLAMADLDEAIRLNPNYAEALDSRGVLFLQLKQFDRAVTDITESIRLTSGNARLYANRGFAYQQLGKHELALDDFNTAINIDPTNVLAYKGRCWERAQKGDQMELELALADCTKSIDLQPENADNIYTHDCRGLVNLRLGRFADALADYEIAVKGDPKQARQLFGRGIAKLHTGDKAGGEADITAAKAIDANISVEFSNYGIAP